MGRPRILVTGFCAFPDAPVNPTERLIAELEGLRAELARDGEIALAVLDVDYRRLPAALRDLAAAGPPDIAIHFGLSASATGFMLERCARNVVGPRLDNAGYAPADGKICAEDDLLVSTLPLERLHRTLNAHGFPTAWSDDAGTYLCNYLFYLSRSLTGFAPEMSGFIHVPPLPAAAPPLAPGTMSLGTAVAGALLIIRGCAAAWAERRA